MAIKPQESLITFSSSAPAPVHSGTVYVNEVTITTLFQNFDRLEFSNAKLREAPTSTGAKPLIVAAFGNQPIQLLTTCTGDTPRPLGPDDSNISSIKKRWNIVRYQIRGAADNLGDVSNLYNVYQSHLIILNAFDLYLAELSMELSIGYLQGTLQALTFTNMQSPGFSISGNVLPGTANNLIITQFDEEAEYEAPLNDGSGNSTVLYSFTMTAENRVLASQGPLSSG